MLASKDSIDSASHSASDMTRDSYFHFPYPSLVEVPDYDVRVAGVSSDDKKKNPDTLRSSQGSLQLRHEPGLPTNSLTRLTTGPGRSC